MVLVLIGILVAVALPLCPIVFLFDAPGWRRKVCASLLAVVTVCLVTAIILAKMAGIPETGPKHQTEAEQLMLE